MDRLSFFACLLILLGFNSCNKNKVSVQKGSNYQLSSESYESDWKEINRMEEKGLGKTIIEKANDILKRALDEKNAIQIFKALTFRSKYINLVEEESNLKILNDFEEQANASEPPLKQILHSASAELYSQYYDQNRWRFNQRSRTANYDPKDLKSWSLDQILERIHYHYQLSLQSPEDLRSYPTKSFSGILMQIDSTSSNVFSGLELRPSLYDFLADRALRYYQRNERRATIPIDEFNPETHSLFSPIDSFLNISFSLTDPGSFHLQSLLIYQDILKTHLKDKNPNVLVDFNLKRLQYAHNISNDELKDSLYLNAIESFAKQDFDFGQAEIDEINYAKANVLSQLGHRYNYHDETSHKYRWYLKKAYQVCEKSSSDETFGGKLCQATQREIEMKQFSFRMENTYIPSEAILFHLNYKNVDSLFFRLIKSPFNIGFYGNIDMKKKTEQLVQKEVFKSWIQPLKTNGDYQNHSTELFIDKLPKGNYYLLSSTSKNFDLENATVAVANFSVSELAYFNRTDYNKGILELFARHRKSGKAIEGAEIVFFENKYNPGQRAVEWVEVAKTTTSSSGFAKYNSVSQNHNISFRITKMGDTLTPSENFYLYQHSHSEREVTRTHLFTDRAIYRPGQTVYFKGIVISTKGDKRKVKTDYKTEINLYNINGEKISSQEMKTNEYGSYHGSFVLPMSGLNGQYRIQDRYGSHYFSVEEYKRPTFKIELDSSTQQQKINEQITISGKVKAFSGSNISDAQISYRVYRKPSYPYWPLYRSFFPPQPQKEITNGKLLSDESGKFSFSFLAKADESIDRSWKPLYNFEIVLQATTPNGETQSLQTSIDLSEQSLFLTTDLDQAITLEELKNAVFKAENINGKSINTDAILTINKLSTPDKIKKPKQWPESDQQSIKNKKYNQLFPSYPKEKEDELEGFTVSHQILKGKIKCNQKNGLINELNPGAYELSLETTDSYGEKIQLTKRFLLYDVSSSTPVYPVFFWSELINDEIEPGEDAEILLASGLKDLKLLFEVEVNGRILSSRWISISDEQKKINIPVTEAHRGNFHLHITAIHSNRIINKSHTIRVPFYNKKLSIRLGTYRDKVKPGSNEEWSLIVKGPQGEAANAEILSSMYDQSLDQFRSAEWDLSLYHSNSSRLRWSSQSFGLSSSRPIGQFNYSTISQPYRSYPQLNWFDFHLGIHGYTNRLYLSAQAESINSTAVDGVKAVDKVFADTEEDLQEVKEKRKAENKIEEVNQIPIRTNFNETAFFYPQLNTDQNGNVKFTFKMPDALTQWKFRVLAHNKGLQIGKLEKSIVTQKELMVSPNTPRFFRVGDKLNFQARIQNLSENSQEVMASVRFFNATTGSPIEIFSSASSDQKLTIQGNSNENISWEVKIPEKLQAIRYVITATSESYSDGEEKIIPVLSNRALITESLPMPIRGGQEKQFKFKSLIENNSSSLNNHSFTLEFTSNPAWYAVQALPYLEESTNECSEQLFHRLFANSLAEHIINSQPKIEEVFEVWKTFSSDELVSKLEQNQELKAILIEETPWLKAAKNETEQKKRIAQLFDLNQMTHSREQVLTKLKELQSPNGGWPWFKGMRDNRYITQMILSGFGHLNKLGVDLNQDASTSSMIKKAIQYLDERIDEDYRNLIEQKRNLEDNQLGSLQIQYLYMRSFFPSIENIKGKVAFEYYLKQAEQFWLERPLLIQAMQALSIYRLSRDSNVPDQILSSLKDRALQNENMGMYWKSNEGGFRWQESSIETQALLIEAFNEISADNQSVEEMKIWLLKQKQTQSWETSRATANACFALLMQGQDLLSRKSGVVIDVGGQLISPDVDDSNPGTGYIKKQWESNLVNNELGTIQVSKSSNGIGWGAAYWQYYEDLDKVRSSEIDELKVEKILFKVYHDKSGEVLKPISQSEVKVGDKVVVRLRIESKRELEFVHLKDQRAGCFEPIDALSSYHYQDGLGYYQSTKDASSNFFFDYLPKGVYVFEYSLRASQIGSFASGISNLQCLYAPEYGVHSKGRVIKISAQ